jgi:hypothetical protein
LKTYSPLFFCVVLGFGLEMGGKECYMSGIGDLLGSRIIMVGEPDAYELFNGRSPFFILKLFWRRAALP